jgi:hypothetical protein
MTDHVEAAAALKALNAMPAREARRAAISFLVSEDTDIRDMMDALADYLNAKCKAVDRRDDDDDAAFWAAERMAEHAHLLMREAEGTL